MIGQTQHPRLLAAPFDRRPQRCDARGRAGAGDRVAAEDARSRSRSAAASVHASGSVNADGAPSGSARRPQISVAMFASSSAADPAAVPRLHQLLRGAASIEFHSDIASTMSCGVRAGIGRDLRASRRDCRARRAASSTQWSSASRYARTRVAPGAARERSRRDRWRADGPIAAAGRARHGSRPYTAGGGSGAAVFERLLVQLASTCRRRASSRARCSRTARTRDASWRCRGRTARS